MLQNSLTYSPSGADLPMGKPLAGPWPAGMRTLRMVVPRALCTYHRIACEGVPFFKLQEFARLQAQQHSPFVHFGASAVKQGQHLHLWLWDQAHEQRFAQKHGNPERFQVLAQSLLTQPAQQGVTWTAQGADPTAGCEAQLWRNRQLQDTQWFDAPPTAQTWQQRHAQYPELAANGWPLQLPALRASAPGTRAWGLNLLARAPTSPTISWQKLGNTTLVVCAAGVMAWAASLQGQMQAYQAIMADNEDFQAQKIAQEQPQQAARAATLNTVQRIKTLQSLQVNSRVLVALEEITQLFSRQGLWVRDIDINGLTIDATLIAPPGVTPRLTAIIGVIESSDLFHDARFTDVVPGGGFRFTWRITPATDSPVAPAQAQAKP